MGTDITDEPKLDNEQAAEAFARLTGERAPHKLTITRWQIQGVGGVKLRSIKGRRRLTTESWIRRFLAERALGDLLRKDGTT